MGCQVRFISLIISHWTASTGQIPMQTGVQSWVNHPVYFKTQLLCRFEVAQIPNSSQLQFKPVYQLPSNRPTKIMTGPKLGVTGRYTLRFGSYR